MSTFLPFQLPNELLLSSIYAQFPCREEQIRYLATLLSPSFPSPRNIVIHGLEATGKSSVVATVLSKLCQQTHSETEEQEDYTLAQPGLKHAIVKSAECITGRHLLEATIGAVAAAVDWKDSIARCENLAQLVVGIGKVIEVLGPQMDEEGFEIKPATQFVLVFDGIDRQRDAPPTLLPALARLAEIIPNLTTVFIVTSPRPHFLHVSNVPHIHFYSYTKAEAVKILALSPPPLHPPKASSSRSSSPITEYGAKTEQERKEFWTRFCSAVWDTLSKHSGHDILSFRNACLRLWPSFTAPIRDGTYSTKDFTRLLVSKRSLLQDEKLLIPSIITINDILTPTLSNGASAVEEKRSSGLITQLPFTSRLLLVASYLASYTPSRNDVLLFSKAGAKVRKKKGGGTAPNRARPGSVKHRKINRKLLGPQAFVLERMMAIFCAVREESSAADAAASGSRTADVPMAVATLASLKLLVKTSVSADVLDASTKWKVNVGWEVIRSVARSVGVEVEDYLVD